MQHDLLYYRAQRGSTNPTPLRVSNVALGAVLLCAALAWLATIAITLTLHQSDPAGNGLSYSYATIGAGVMCILVAIALLIGLSHVARPPWLSIVAFLGFASTSISAFTVINLLKEENAFTANWPIVSLVVPTLLILAFAAWASFPTVQRLAEPRVMFTSLWIGVIAFSSLPVPVRAAQKSRIAAARLQQARAVTDRDAEESALNLGALTALPDTAALSAFLDLATRSTEMRTAVLSRVSSLPNRQRDAIAMLKARDERVMGELRNLALEPTPELCENAIAFLTEHAFAHRAKLADYNNRFVVAEQDLEKFLFGMQWLAEHRCDVRPAVTEYKASAMLYPEAPERAKFLARLDAIASL